MEYLRNVFVSDMLKANIVDYLFMYENGIISGMDLDSIDYLRQLEVLSNDENTKPSFHEKIRIASVREYDYDSVCKDIDELIAISHGEDDMATVKKMKEIVPEYKSNNSIYSALD